MGKMIEIENSAYCTLCGKNIPKGQDGERKMIFVWANLPKHQLACEKCSKNIGEITGNYEKIPTIYCVFCGNEFKDIESIKEHGFICNGCLKKQTRESNFVLVGLVILTVPWVILVLWWLIKLFN